MRFYANCLHEITSYILYCPILSRRELASFVYELFQIYVPTYFCKYNNILLVTVDVVGRRHCHCRVQSASALDVRTL